MEIVFERTTKIRPLGKSHFNQMLAYLNAREREEWYYGNERQFNKRHDEIRVWIEDCIRLLDK